MKKFLLFLTVISLLFCSVSFGEGEKGPVTLTCYISETGEAPAENNKIYRMIEEQFGLKFQFEFLEGDMFEKIGRIASGAEDCPDLIMSMNGIPELIEAGKLLNLLDYISPEKTPRLWAHFEPWMYRLVRKDADGNDALYTVPCVNIYDGGQIATSVNGNAFYIQKQVLEWAGYPEIHTLDDYFDMIEAFLKENPKDENGEEYIGFSILDDDWRYAGLVNPVQFLMGRPYDGNVLVDLSSEDFHTETFIDKPYAKIYYKKLNEEYHKGVIAENNFENDFEVYSNLIGSGRVLGVFDQGWNIQYGAMDLKDKGMPGHTYAALGLTYSAEDLQDVPLPFENRDLEEHYLNGSVPIADYGFGISVNCSCPERIVAMWEEMMSDEWQLILNWGIKDEDYFIDDDGRLNMTREQADQRGSTDWKPENKADDLFNFSPKKQGYIMEDIQLGSQTVAAGNTWSPSTQPELVYMALDDYDKAFLDAYGYRTFADFFNPPAELPPYGEAWQLDYTPVADAYFEIDRIQRERLPELITCDPEAFDGKWDAFAEEIGEYTKPYEEYMQTKITETMESLW